MILSNEGICAALRDGQLVIQPEPQADQYTTSAVDLYLGDRFREWDPTLFAAPGSSVRLNLAEQHFRATAGAYLKAARLEKDGSIVLPPRSGLLLGITRERIELRHGSRLAARVEGRSSFARLGLIVHLTAPTIHAGFEGNITLEMINWGPFHLVLVPGKTRICQLILERLESPPKGLIQTGFSGQRDPSGTRKRPRRSSRS